MEDNGFTVDAVTAAISGDKESFLTAFNNAIASKVTDALEVKKVEIASNLLGVQDELQASQTEFDGSADVTTDTSAEVAATAEV
jgi:hypothetical protein